MATIVSMDMITSTASYTRKNKIELYIHLKILEKDNLNLAWWKKIKIVFHLLSGAFTSRVKIQSQRTEIMILEYLPKLCSNLLSGASTCSVNSSHDLKTPHNWLLSCKTSTTVLVHYISTYIKLF